MSKKILELQDIHRHFIQGEKDLHILKGVNFTLKTAEVVVACRRVGVGQIDPASDRRSA